MTTSAAQSTLSHLQTALAGRYAFERELGRGGMATVHLARDLRQDRHVAVKVLLAEVAMGLGTERFLREIELAATLAHPRIVGVLDSGRVSAPAGEDGILYYVMPFIDGPSLRDRLNQSVQLPIEEALTVTRQVAEALAFAHSKGVIHRDIKPENILLSENGAVVADFGVARAASLAGGQTLTRTGVAVGTPTYMSPEQAMGSRDVTPESDLYSLACVTYEMLAGQPPFTGPTPGIVISRHVLDTPPNLRIMRGGVDDAIADAIERALAKSPADRFRSVADFAVALTDREGAARRRREKQGVERAALGQPAGRPLRRRWVARASLALALLFLAPGAWFWWRSWRLASPSPDLPKSSIAVLPFQDRSPAGALGMVADGLSEALILQLDAVPQLDVASRNASLFFAERGDVPIDSIARALGTGTLITGRVEPVGENVAVEVELWDGTTGWRIGRERIDGPKTNAVALHDSLVSVVTRRLRERLGGPSLEVASRRGTRNPTAWDAFWRARQLVTQFDSLRRAGDSAGGIVAAARADSALAAAQRMDEYWAEPHIERARLAYAVVRMTGRSDSAFVSRIDAGLAHAGAAVELTPNDSRALEARGVLRYWGWLNNITPDSAVGAALLLSAEQDLTAAATNRRLQAGAWNTLSHLLLNKGQLLRASAAAERAFELDPYVSGLELTIYRLFVASLEMGYADQARQWCAEGSRRDPTSFRSAECRLWLQALPGAKPDMVEAWRQYDEYVTRSPSRLRKFNALKGRMIVALVAARAGLTDSARHLAEASMGDSLVDPRRELADLAVIVFTQLGDADRAMELLWRQVEALPSRRAQLAGDRSVWLRDLRSDPRYQALIRQPAR